MVVYKEESYSDIMEELKELLPEWYAEVDRYEHSPKPEFDHDVLLRMDSDKALQVITSRNEGKLVGFHISFIIPDIFYKGTMKGYVALFFMSKKFRGRGRGTGMFEFADKKFNDKKVDMVYMTHRIYIDCSKMFSSLGYTPFEKGYYKVVNN